MNYYEQLQDERWLNKRDYILERDNHRCQHPNCSNILLLEVHHLDYIYGLMAWEYPDDMLITLCKTHHTAEQARAKVEKYLFDTLKMKGFLLCDLLNLSCKIDTDTEFTETLLNVLRNG